jgi:hypothetical protein
MPCYYVSVVDTQITDLKTLCEALDKMGHEYTVQAIGNAAVIASRHFRIEFNPEKGTSIDRADGNRKWIEQLQNRYAAEKTKKSLKRKGFFVKEESLPDGRIKLSMRK